MDKINFTLSKSIRVKISYQTTCKNFKYATLIIVYCTKVFFIDRIEHVMYV